MSAHGASAVDYDASNPCQVGTQAVKLATSADPGRTMPNANEQSLRDAYAAFGRGDLEGFFSYCTDDFVFRAAPGNNQVAGEYKGLGSLQELVGKIMTITGGKFEEIVHDVVANDEHGVVLVSHRLTRTDGAEHSYDAAHVYHLRDGKLAEAWECPADPTAFDKAWA